MRHAHFGALVLFAMPLGAVGGESAPLADNETARINYSLGYQIGGDFKRQGVELDAAVVVQGIEDALSGDAPRIAPEQMHATLLALKRKVVAEQQERLRQARREGIAQDRRFLEENARRAGVITRDSGLQYEILAQGTGPHPSVDSEVLMHYRGTLTDGQEFDSSHERGDPAAFRLDGVIEGLAEGLQLIGEGGRMRLFIPPALGYGTKGPLADRALVFEVELISVAQAADGR